MKDPIKIELQEGEAVINVDAAADDVARMVLRKFQGNKAFDADGNVHQYMTKFYNDVCHRIWCELMGAARVNHVDFKKSISEKNK